MKGGFIMYKSFVSVDFELIFQLLNILFLFILLGFIIWNIFILPKKIKNILMRLDKLEHQINNIKLK